MAPAEPITYHGPTLSVAPLAAADEPQVVAALASPHVYQPLDLRRPPTADEIARREVPSVEWPESTPKPVDLLAVKYRHSGALAALWLSYGWDHPHDRTREIDTASFSSTLGVGELLESWVIAGALLVVKGNARRLRWRFPMGAGVRRHYQLLGIREIGSLRATDPNTGEPVMKTLFELTSAEARAMFARAGIPDPLTHDGFELSIAECLRRLRQAKSS